MSEQRLSEATVREVAEMASRETLRLVNARWAKALALADLLAQAHAVCAEVVMDTPEERALHERHVEQMRDLDHALRAALSGDPGPEGSA